MKIEIKSIYGDIIFSFEKENNTIKDTVEEAVRQCVNLNKADLHGANLNRANLREAGLREADLRSTNLYRADLREADLRGSDLRMADLRETDLCRAELLKANLYGANLYGADLYGAYLRGAGVTGARNLTEAISRTVILPEGDIIGYKRCRGNVIVRLRIPPSAKRSSAFGRKCRAEFVEVLEIISDSGITEARSIWDSSVTYEVGKIVRPVEPFNEDWMEECASGIHFYITKEEAENHI